MNTKQQLKKFEASLDIIRSITRAFEHTATQRMAVNRQEIEKIGEHVREAKQTYATTKLSILQKGVSAVAAGQLVARTLIKRRVVVLISSEPQYYGSLLGTMAAEFLAEIENGAEGIIIGKPGADEVGKETKKKINFTAFDFDDNKPDWGVIASVSAIIGQYREIIVIFAQFESILKQDVRREDLAGNITVPQQAARKKYLIKPDAKSALNYLEHQIIGAGLLQKLYENGLAKSAVRVKILEIGEIAEKLTVAIERFERFKRKVIREINNRKLVNLYSGESVWEQKSIFTVFR